MSPIDVAPAQAVTSQDLGPLAWVLDDLRASLSGAGQAVRRFVWEEKAENRWRDTPTDTSYLRQARQKFNQSAGALEMVGQHGVAQVLRALEALAHKFVQWPEICTEDAVGRVERANRAVVGYVEGLLKGSQASPVALFPQQRDVMELSGAERIHPADLWRLQWKWQWLQVDLPAQVQPLPYSPEVRARMGDGLLPVLKMLDASHSRQLARLCCALAVGEGSLQGRTFWAIAAGFFEAIEVGCLPDDLYVRRSAARIIAQYAAMATGQAASPEGVARDLVFYCALANPPANVGAGMLRAVRAAYALDVQATVNYEASPFGRFDPTQLAVVRKRIDVAAENWSALAGGDLSRFGAVVEQFGQVGEAVAKLHSDNLALVAALNATAQATARTNAAPSPAIAMEVATSILYLEAAYDDLDLASHTMGQRSARLAARLQQVCTGAVAQPIEGWMEDLYRRVSDQKTMGSVVVELRVSLSEIEKTLEKYSSEPSDPMHLRPVPVILGQMRGVFSVLGLEQAALAALRMRSRIEKMLESASAAQWSSKPLAPQLVSSLSSMGFLIDMLNYQPAMAKELFEFDEQLGEFKPSMDREISLAQRSRLVKASAPHLEKVGSPWNMLPSFPEETVRATPPTVLLEAPPDAPLEAVSRADVESDDDDEIREIFLAEAREVAKDGLGAVDALGQASADVSAQTTLRRVFHTLKGSARMVGLHDFGAAAWSFEQLFTTCLAEQRPSNEALAELCKGALHALMQWLDAIAAGQDAPAQKFDFQGGADSMRLKYSYEPMELTFSEPPGLPGAPSSAVLPVPSTLSNYRTAADAGCALSGGVAPDIAVGHLRLSADFFEVFIEEAQVWSQRLQAELLQWDIQRRQAMPEDAAALAHSLLGSAAAVGFTSLWGLLRAMEQALNHVALHGLSDAQCKSVLCDAADEMTRLLAGFSNGTLVDANAAILAALADLLVDEGGVENHEALGAPEAKSERVFPSAMDSSGAPQMQMSAVGAVAPPDLVLDVALSSTPLEAVPTWEQEFDAKDALDAELLSVFLEEGSELLSSLGASLRLWEKQPDQPQFRAQALRVLHTLKGSARLAGALRLGELAHHMESEVERVTAQATLQLASLESCLAMFDQIEAMFDALRGLADLNQPEPKMAPVDAPGSSLLAPRTDGAALAASVPATPAAYGRPALGQWVRVRVPIMDRLIDQAGEVMISRARVDEHVTHMRGTLGELNRSLDRLRQQLREMELEAELQMQSSVQQPQESALTFDPLELDRFTRVQEVSRMMAESVNDVDAMRRSLQSAVDGAQEELFAQDRRAKQLSYDLLRMRLVEFESVTERLYGVVRQAAKGEHKQVRLDIVGGTIAMDRGVLDRMTPAFEHLLRNAVVHGIEPKEVRLTAGKPATGAILIVVKQEGGDVSVSFSDDGAGLQIENIRARAVASQLLRPDQSLDADEAARLLFIPGFSTAPVVTELAGRGVGLDVVLSDVSAIGGRIETESQSGLGTRFNLVFPLTTAVTQVVMLRMGTASIGVPANLVETVLRLPKTALDSAYAASSLSDGDGPPIPFFRGEALLKVSNRSYGHEAHLRQHAVVVIRSAGQRIALHVDEVLGSREVVVKHLGPQLSRLPGLTGMSVLASGAIVLIYNPVALASLYGEAARSVQSMPMALDTDASGGAGLAGAHGGASDVAPLVLVVDDSITVRRVTQRLLLREGYRVALAADGFQALELLQDERPAVVLSDIEMPRMDGMELARQIRGDSSLAKLPIIVITSRIAQKHRDHAAALGVNHYLGKPYAEADLLELVQAYCLAPTRTSASWSV